LTIYHALLAFTLAAGLLTITPGLAASVGLGTLLAASQVAYRALRIAGACYLIFLGAKMLLRKRRSAFAIDDAASPTVFASPVIKCTTVVCSRSPNKPSQS